MKLTVEEHAMYQILKANCNDQGIIVGGTSCPQELVDIVDKLDVNQMDEIANKFKREGIVEAVGWKGKQMWRLL